MKWKQFFWNLDIPVPEAWPESSRFWPSFWLWWLFWPSGLWPSGSISWSSSSSTLLPCNWKKKSKSLIKIFQFIFVKSLQFLWFFTWSVMEESPSLASFMVPLHWLMILERTIVLLTLEPKEKWKYLVFCYQNCSDLLWKKIVLVIEKNFWNSRLKAESLRKIWDH